MIWGELDFPHIRQRCRQIVPLMRRASGHELTGTAHLPTLDRPAEVTDLVAGFVSRLPGHPLPPV